MLARRDYAEQEIRFKLQRKGFNADAISLVLKRLVETGLISDHRFTESFIHWRQQQGYGPNRVRQELLARGVAVAIIAEHLDIADNAWFKGAAKVWQKHFKGRHPTDFKTRAKQMRFLQYRGFTREHIESVLATSEISDEETYIE